MPTQLAKQQKNQFSDIEILEKICKTKLSKMQSLGFSLGHKIPTHRELPLTKPSILQPNTSLQKEINSNVSHIEQNLKFPFIIAEIKRASPTKGKISSIPNPINLAKEYLRQGASAISVLCEEDYFQGSISDLQNIKTALPHSCILRKDFILCKEEIEISYLAGADMVLLITGLFLNDFEKFKGIYNEIIRFNLTPLLEIHDEEEWDFICRLDLSQAIVGINCRDLRSFNINKMNALKLRMCIPNIPVIFESGINNANECYIIANSGFNGILCGSFLVSSIMNENRTSEESNIASINSTSSNDENKQNPSLQNQNISLFCHALKQGSNKSRYKYNRMLFYQELLLRFHIKNKEKRDAKSYNAQHISHTNKDNTKTQIPLIKVCGINNINFFDSVLDKADLIGFILIKESPRFVGNGFVKKANERIKDYILTRELDCNSNFDCNRHARDIPLRIGVVGKDSLQIGLELLEEGLLDALQLHGLYHEFNNAKEINNTKEENSYFPCYHAIKTTSLLDMQAKNMESIKDSNVTNNSHKILQPLQTQYFTLIDSSQGQNIAIDINTILQITKNFPQFIGNLWLAGGINEENLINVLSLNPMLIDICSGFESAKGIKDISKLNSFFDKAKSIFDSKKS